MLSIENMLLNSALGNLVLALCFAGLAWRFWQDLRTGENGLTKAMFMFFLALAVDRLWSVGVAVLAACGVTQYRELMLILRGTVIIFLLYSLANLYLETRNASEND